MKNRSLLSLSLVVLAIPSFSFATEISNKSIEQEILSSKTTTAESSMDLNKDLKKATSGFGRFRFGVSAGAGYYKSASVKNYPNVSSFAGELGLYTLFNPIRDWADVELGVRGLYAFAHDKKSNNSKTGKTEEKSYSGLSSGSIYAGVVFRFPNSSSAFATGVYQDFFAKSTFSDKQKLDTEFTKSLKYKPGQGVYAEYQWIGFSKNSSGVAAIPFFRATYGTYKSEYKTALSTQTNREKLFGVMLGVKF
ncbi:hypothetical protein ACWIUH_09795 [Ursidibacter arcticus]